jgi:hypothetical protein
VSDVAGTALQNAINGSLQKANSTETIRYSTYYEPQVGVVDSLKKDIKNTGARNWRGQSQGRGQWWTILEDVKAHQGL